MNIVKSSAHMKANIFSTSPLETECLFGEKIEILKENSDSVYCKLMTDNYCGWVKKNNLGRLPTITHRVINIRTFIYKEPNEKSDFLLYLPMGSVLSIETIKAGWAKTIFFPNDKVQVGYIPCKHIINIQDKILDWVTFAEQLEGTPYRWGGRDTIGIDCSALLQLSYQTCGQAIPRNTSDQVETNKEVIDKINDLHRGCVIFWEGHVGIMVDNVKCIHANAFHMKVVTEPLVDILRRMGKNNIVKMMNFN